MKNWICLFAACLCACQAASNIQPALTREELRNPESCKECHPKHYEQWSASMHAYASKDPVFLAMNKRGQEATNGMLGDFCVSCHAPMAVRENKFTGAGVEKFSSMDTVPPEYQGVTCFFCHNAVGVENEHFNGKLLLADDNVMRAAVDNPIEPSTHKVAFSAFHNPLDSNSSLLCGTCHDINTPRGLHLERTYEEYTASVFSQKKGGFYESCQDCHMAYVGDKQQIATQTGRPGETTNSHLLHGHLWPAVDLPLTDWPHADAMRSAVEDCELRTKTIPSYVTLDRTPGPLGQLTVTLEADAGHKFPSGAAQDRRVWVEVAGYDAANKQLFNLGVIPDGQVEQPEGAPDHPCMFREYMLDQNGKETHNFWDAASFDKKGELLPFAAIGTVIMAGSHSKSCTFRPPLAVAAVPAAQVDVTVRVRPMGLDVLQDLVSTGHLAPDMPGRMQTMTVTKATFVYREASRSYEAKPLLAGDCDRWQCMLDPQSPACANTSPLPAAGGQAGNQAGNQAAAGAAAPGVTTSGVMGTAGVGAAPATTPTTAVAGAAAPAAAAAGAAAPVSGVAAGAAAPAAAGAAAPPTAAGAAAPSPAAGAAALPAAGAAAPPTSGQATSGAAGGTSLFPGLPFQI